MNIRKIREFYWELKRDFIWLVKNHGVKIFILIPLNSNIVFFKKAINKFKKIYLNVLKKLTKYLKIIDILMPRPNGNQRYLRSNLTPDDFFAFLKSHQVRYIIIEPFIHESSSFNNKEKTAILIYDQDLSKISEFFSYVPSNYSFTIYGVFGHECAWKFLPYYKPIVAQKIIRDSVFYNELYRVPNIKDQYYIALYYNLIHIGNKSFLNRSDLAVNQLNNSESLLFFEQLKKLANMTEQPLIDNFNDAYSLLTAINWIPELDTLRKIALNNSWIHQRINLAENSDQFAKPWKGELLIFIIRDWAFTNNYWEKIIDWFQRYDHAMSIFELKVFNQEERSQATNNIRGGVWSTGIYPKNGGYPAALIALYNFHPDKQSALLNSHPFVKNPLYLLKSRVRWMINCGEFYSNQSNFIHSSDDETEALSYVKSIYNTRDYELFITKLQKYVLDFESEPYPIIKDLSSFRARAKVELIDFQGQLAVKKTYKPGKSAFFKREIFAYESLSSLCGYIPPLLAKGNSYFIIPYYKNKLADFSETESFAFLREQGLGLQILEFMKFLYQNGYALIDLRLANIIVTEDHQLKVIDYEYLYKYSKLPETFEKSLNMKGTDSSFDGDTPRGYQHPGYNYRNYWSRSVTK